MILNFKDELRRTSEHFNRISEMHAIGSKEAELKYKEELYAVQEEFERRRKNMAEQYEHLIQAKEEEREKFMRDAEKYVKAKK
jgi:hypothetical protein